MKTNIIITVALFVIGYSFIKFPEKVQKIIGHSKDYDDKRQKEILIFGGWCLLILGIIKLLTIIFS